MQNESTIPLKEMLGSVASFSSLIYLIILTLSIGYNIGYLKQINAQIIDLMELGDYFALTIHNILFFLLGAIIFFITSLAFVKIKIGEQFIQVLAFGVFTFIISAYFLLKGIYYSKFWPVLKQVFNNKIFSSDFITITLISGVIILLIYFYSLVLKLIKGHISTILAGNIPVVIFLFLILMPYIGGMIHGYIENKYLSKENYEAIHSVDLIITPDNELLKNIFIIKKLNKGLVIRQFGDGGAADKFKFINWANIKSITYKKLGEPLSPI